MRERNLERWRLFEHSGDTFSEPVTLNLYDVGGDGTSVGSELATVTDDLQHPVPPIGQRQLRLGLPGSRNGSRSSR